MELPLVTFISPCYNHSRYVIESLDSIKRQTYPNIQHIIIDDCSKDDSAYKIQKWIDENEYGCEFIRHKSNRGISYTLNESIEMTKGVFWTPLATDDFIEPERTAVFVLYLMEHPEANMVTSDCQLVNEKSEKIFINGTSSFLQLFAKYRTAFSMSEDYGTYKSLLKGNYIPGSLMIRKEIFSKVGLFDSNLKIEDWDMWLKIAQLSRLGHINEYLTYYRFHDANSYKEIDSIEVDDLKVFFKQYKFCKKNNLFKEYKKIYLELFKHKFSLKGNKTTAKLFFDEGPKDLLLETLAKKLLRKVISD